MNCLNLERIDDRLRLTLTTEGHEELQCRLDEGESIETDSVLYDLLEWHLANGWDWVQPVEVGALTSAPLITESWTCDEDGFLLSISELFWFADYQIRSPVRELFDSGYVDFQRAE